MYNLVIKPLRISLQVAFPPSAIQGLLQKIRRPCASEAINEILGPFKKHIR